MESISLIIQLVIPLIALIWSIVNFFILYEQNKRIIFLQSNCEKKVHVSNIVFDKLFLEFQKLSECLFDGYNIVQGKLFPFIEQEVCFLSKDEKKQKMKAYLDETVVNINNLVRLIHSNKFMLPSEILNNLLEFEKDVKFFMQAYKHKVTDVLKGVNPEHGYITPNKEEEYSAKATELSKLYEKIETEMKKYLESLQVER